MRRLSRVGGTPSSSFKRSFMNKILAALLSFAFAGAVLMQTPPAAAADAPKADTPKAEKAPAQKPANKKSSKAKPKASTKTEEKKA
jgi:hypothetical protein